MKPSVTPLVRPKKNNAMAQSTMAFYLAHGFGVAQNYREAVRYARAAAAQGFSM
jgi:TPR repeat protein